MYYNLILKINLKKLEYMCIGKRNDRIKQPDKFKYLGSCYWKMRHLWRGYWNQSSDRKQATSSFCGLIWNKRINEETKIKIFQSIIKNIITCAEIWPPTNKKDKIWIMESYGNYIIWSYGIIWKIWQLQEKVPQFTREDKVRTASF